MHNLEWRPRLRGEQPASLSGQERSWRPWRALPLAFHLPPASPMEGVLTQLNPYFGFFQEWDPGYVAFPVAE